MGYIKVHLNYLIELTIILTLLVKKKQISRHLLKHPTYPFLKR